MFSSRASRTAAMIDAAMTRVEANRSLVRRSSSCISLHEQPVILSEVWRFCAKRSRRTCGWELAPNCVILTGLGPISRVRNHLSHTYKDPAVWHLACVAIVEPIRFARIIFLEANRMSSPALLHPQVAVPRTPLNQWVPVLFSLAFVCCTSTSFMGGSHTQAWLEDVWQVVLGKWHWDLTGPVNEVCRKVGHFFGYGMIGLLFRSAWHSSIRAHLAAINYRSLGSRLLGRRLMLSASGLSVLCTFVVAALDEWHQRYLPGRVSSFRDILLDTAGALVLNLAFWSVCAQRRRRAPNALSLDRG
jgi:VanZ family protein